jgi:hypothetical protein
MAVDPPLFELYPKALTNDAWQKQKSSQDKKQKGTGLGDELKKLAAAWKKIQWKKLDARTQGKWRSAEDIRAAKQFAQKYKLQSLTQFYNVVMAVNRKATATGKIATLSAPAKNAAKKIATDTKAIADALLDMPFTDFDEEEARFLRGIKVWRDRLPGNIKALEKALDELEDAPSLAKWAELDMTNVFRSVGNSVGNNPEFKDLWPDPWQKLDGLQETRHPVLKKLAGKKTSKKGTAPSPAEIKGIQDLIAQARGPISDLKKRL